MNTMVSDIPDNPKEACRKYICELDRIYYTWYSHRATLHIWLTLSLQLISIISGFLASILISLFQPNDFPKYSGPHILLIVLPALASLASTLLVQLRIRDLIPLRERGRRQFQKLIDQAKAEYAAIASTDEYTKLHLRLIEEVDSIEDEQTDEFARGLPGPAN